MAGLAGVSVRTLPHYDEIGLVRPSARTAAGYRTYAAGDVERLREVLGYRRLGFGLREIAELVDDPATDAAVMRAQRPPGAARCVAASAQRLPFPDGAFDAAMAVSTVHHRPDPVAGLREMRRVARRVVVFTYDACDPGRRERFRLTRDYLPEFAGLRTDWPALADLTRAIGGRAEPVLIPWDCADGFFEAHRRQPEAYLEDRVRRAVSVWTRVGPEAERRAVTGLRDDLASGRWTERNRGLLALDAAELGLRLLIA
ncbi:hypothetical protein CXR04_10165 [Streptomyces sp. CMB-StM0423]|nr:hypothetical protein CXR04_10165 [Streptomyces sp. CMB-StM0423]